MREAGVELYRNCLSSVKDGAYHWRSLPGRKIRGEEMHLAEIEKMLRRRGDA